jgi:hypothetical protein
MVQWLKRKYKKGTIVESVYMLMTSMKRIIGESIFFVGVLTLTAAVFLILIVVQISRKNEPKRG